VTAETGGRKMGLREGTKRTELWQKDDWQKMGSGHELHVFFTKVERCGDGVFTPDRETNASEFAGADHAP